MPIPDHIYKFQVKEHHLDTFAHVNNAVYLQLFEEARWDWITANGYGLEEVRSSGLGPVILEIKINFKRELKLRRQITINTYVSDAACKICTLKQEMIDEEGRLCCAAEFSFGLFDLNKRKLVNPTDKWLKAISPAH